jgi:hypothetical protein
MQLLMINDFQWKTPIEILQQTESEAMADYLRLRSKKHNKALLACERWSLNYLKAAAQQNYGTLQTLLYLKELDTALQRYGLSTGLTLINDADLVTVMV